MITSVVFLSPLISSFSSCSDSLAGSDSVKKNGVFVPVMAAKCNGGVVAAAALERGSVANGAYPGRPFVCGASEKVSPINRNTRNVIPALRRTSMFFPLLPASPASASTWFRRRCDRLTLLLL